MNINELMIGDWASCHYINKDGNEIIKNFQVSSVITESFWHPDSVWGKEYGNMGADHIEPVSLTKEIFEKNGFEGISPWWHFDDLSVRLCSGSVTIIKDEDYFRCNIPAHVHEFQHALRLCGLRDLADNFKI